MMAYIGSFPGGNIQVIMGHDSCQVICWLSDPNFPAHRIAFLPYAIVVQLWDESFLNALSVRQQLSFGSELRVRVLGDDCVRDGLIVVRDGFWFWLHLIGQFVRHGLRRVVKWLYFHRLLGFVNDETTIPTWHDCRPFPILTQRWWPSRYYGSWRNDNTEDVDV